MKRIVRLFYIALIFALMMSINSSNTFGVSNNKNITILFSHDMHDHFLPFKVEQNGKIEKLGGYARLQNAINEEKRIDPNLVLIDAGDYSMGTLFQSIYSSDSPELRIMGKLGYDVVTLGNHEYDFRAQGLADSLNSAKKSGDKLPQMVVSNITFPTDKNGKLTESLKNLKQAMNNFGVKDYTVINRNGIKIGVFGLIGKDAASNAPKAEVRFEDAVENAKRVVGILTDKEKVDLIICLSHSGLWNDKSKSEDEILAKKVPQIDVIISGHTHTKLDQPIKVGKTIIGSCGEYGEDLGIINVSNSSDNTWKLENYSLKQIDGSLGEDPKISSMVSNYKKLVQQKYLNNFDLKFDDVLANAPFNFISTSQIGVKHAEDTLGDFISDAYIYAVKKAEGSNYEPVTMALVPSGTIRGSFVKGDITVADAFTVSSLGIGKDKISGYPLISVYLTGKELKTACEVDASIAPIMSTAQLYMSGLSFTFNPNRLIFNKVTRVNLQNPDGYFEKIDDSKLYRVVAGLYSAQMLSVVGKKSYGLLSIVPKTKDGKPITDFEAQIIKDTASGRNNEVKEWLAIAEYLKSFEKVNGISQIPIYYNETHNRKIVDDNHNIISILSHPNTIALILYSLIIIILALIIFLLTKLFTRKKRRQKRLANRLKTPRNNY